MTLTNRTCALLCAAIMFGPTVGIGVAKVAIQAPDGSEGWHIAEGAAKEPNPQPLNPAVLARGQSLYKAKCQRCHGADGAGHGPEVDPDHPAGNLADGSKASRNPDGVLFYKIWNGRAKPKMPAMNTDITRNDVWAIVHYVKTLRNNGPTGRRGVTRFLWRLLHRARVVSAGPGAAPPPPRGPRFSRSATARRSRASATTCLGRADVDVLKANRMTWAGGCCQARSRDRR